MAPLVGGAEHLFIVWTDHIDLQYIQTARRLNSCQGRGALFCGCFNFSLNYRPGCQNTKPDALVCKEEDSDEVPDNIVPCSCIVGAITWNIEREVREA